MLEETGHIYWEKNSQPGVTTTTTFLYAIMKMFKLHYHKNIFKICLALSIKFLLRYLKSNFLLCRENINIQQSQALKKQTSLTLTSFDDCANKYIRFSVNKD